MRTNTSPRQKERPILFSAPMVRAILEDRKTQTRRIVKPQPIAGESIYALWSKTGFQVGRLRDSENAWRDIACPYGVADDRLWVRETWARESDLIAYDKGGNPIFYRADHPTGLFHDSMEPMPWRPSIHMPRWASRITLEITKVRVERLQDISALDVLAEGVQHGMGCNSGLAKYPNGVPEGINADRNCDCRAFQVLWESINGKGAWDANPWVWVLEFKRVLCGNVTESDTGSFKPKSADAETACNRMPQ